MNPSLSSHDIITGLPVAAFTVDANGIIIQVNEAAEILTGKTSQNVIGKKSWMLFHDKKQMTAVDEAINQGSAVNNKVFLSKGNQNPVVVEVSVNPLIDTQGEVKGAIGLIKPEDNALVRLNSAVNGSSSPMMMVDRDLKITFANPATMNMLRKNLETFKKVFPGFDLEGILGSSIDRFHKNPAHQRTLLGDPKNLPYRAEIQVGPLTFDLNVSAMKDASGQYIGNTLEWHDISEAKQAQLRNLDYEGLANAVSKSQAIIEFNLDGSIITANENFLSVMGYALKELQGQHHRLFVEPTYAQSVEYRIFWEKLGKGEYDAGEYKRFGKGGKEIWIHGSYNPILDSMGRPYKVIKYATEITKTKLKNADYQGQLSAIGKSQAVIEFNLDGTIITANENFLKTVGYSLAEIQGKHHRLFVTPEYAQSQEYRSFWEKLNRGEFDANEYKRIGNGGKEIWIQASYNPILDMNGRPFKVVKYASDITQQKREALEKELARQVFTSEVKRLIDAGKNGDLSTRGDTASVSSEWKLVLQGINDIVDSIVAPIDELRAKLTKVATGDLTAYVSGDYKGDHQLLKSALNDTLDSLNDILGQVSTAADQVANGARQVSESSQALSQGATEQASSLEEITASMTEMACQTKQNAENATQANQLAGSARQGAERGNLLMQDMVKAMAEIDDSSQNISKIIKAIDEIAFQTNLLALNAAVEAARAGVHGKGFAVVAEEVRNLAARSAKAAKETTEMIEGSIKKVNQGSDIARKTAEALVDIVSGVGKVSDLVGEIAAASNEQAQGISQVNQGLNQLDSVTQQNTSSAEESAAASEELSSQSTQLRELLSKFTLQQNSASLELPAGITPEIFAALKAFMAQQGMATGGATRERQPAKDWSAVGSPAKAAKTAQASKPVIALDDREFGKY
jgi:methyl-accepting chemotaxis protein